MKKQLFWLGKALEGIGLLVILAGVLISIDLGLKEEGLKSMAYEFQALGIGGGLFLVGFLLERGANRG